MAGKKVGTLVNSKAELTAGKTVEYSVAMRAVRLDT